MSADENPIEWPGDFVADIKRLINERHEVPLVYRIKMSWIIAILSAAMVFIAIIVASMTGYWVASNSLIRSSEATLEDQANQVLTDASFRADLQRSDYSQPIGTSRLRSPGLYLMIVRPAVNATPERRYDIWKGSDQIALDPEDWAVVNGHTTFSQRQSGDRMHLATATGVNGWTLILAQDMSALRSMTSHMSVVFTIMAAIGALMALLAGWAVARTSLVPVQTLIVGAERIAQTDDIKPLPVHGSDELARLTESFNEMLASLQESRTKQSQLVADAGHELKTPLTSLRTNMELLILASQNPAAPISEEDIAALQHDVMSQLEELTTLVTDLVDLAREDSHYTTVEPIDLGEILDSVVDRVKRRRQDINFEIHTIEWYLMGDHRGLSRSLLNVLDNAAKWSPAGGTVTMTMKQVKGKRLQITVDDEGPGIPFDERSLVFERFYRSVESRSMPGSGLGLAIVKSVMHSHGGKVYAAEAPSGGARIVMLLPGGPRIDDTSLIDIRTR